jgi:hypothetical protein
VLDFPANRKRPVTILMRLDSPLRAQTKMAAASETASRVADASLSRVADASLSRVADASLSGVANLSDLGCLLDTHQGVGGRGPKWRESIVCMSFTKITSQGPAFVVSDESVAAIHMVTKMINAVIPLHFDMDSHTQRSSWVEFQHRSPYASFPFRSSPPFLYSDSLS